VNVACVFDITSNPTSAMPTPCNTLIRFGGQAFCLASFPFNCIPNGKINPTPYGIISAINLKAEPIEPGDWRTKLQQGEVVRFRGIKAGTSDEKIVMDMKAEKSSSPNEHLIISFVPVHSPAQTPQPTT
jgi:hypothetical protein